jgi:hypothetical protein
MGYCLGGTLLAIAAAALAKARRHGVMDATPDCRRWRLTLLAAQTDFSEPGELGLFIDESQIGYLDDITRGQGYLSGKQMAGSFQFLHSRDLVWTRRMREYLMGEREQPNDLMAWNADTTRMPARMHHEYLTSLYLHNALATSSYRVHGQAVSLADLRICRCSWSAPSATTSRPGARSTSCTTCATPRSTFVLTSGGHNAGIISEPGHAHRSYRMRASSVYIVGTTKMVSRVPRLMPPTITQPICCRLSAPGAGGQRQRNRAQHHGAGGHQNRPQALGRAFWIAASHVQPLLAQLVGKLDDQDPVFGDQAHQRDQADLAEYTFSVPPDHFSASSAPIIDRGTTEQDHQRIDKALELRRQHQEDEDQRQHEHQRQRVPATCGTRGWCRSGRCCSRA